MKRLGLFGGVFDWNECRPLVREALKGMVGYLEDSLVERVADYLDRGALVDPWMEYTDDLIGGAFGVAGGSATMTDGVYIWRSDTAAYVRTYRIALPLEFLEHGESLAWQMPTLDETDIAHLRAENRP